MNANMLIHKERFNPVTMANMRFGATEGGP